LRLLASEGALQGNKENHFNLLIKTANLMMKCKLYFFFFIKSQEARF